MEYPYPYLFQKRLRFSHSFAAPSVALVSGSSDCHKFLSGSFFFSSFFKVVNFGLIVLGYCRAMASHVVGYPRMGPKRELKFALESFWDGKSSADELQNVAADLRASIWKQMADAGIKFIPSNTFSYYDQVLDTTAMLGAVPPRYSWNGGEIGFDVYFSMARGNASVPAMEMTKWFDTN